MVRNFTDREAASMFGRGQPLKWAVETGQIRFYIGGVLAFFFGQQFQDALSFRLVSRARKQFLIVLDIRAMDEPAHFARSSTKEGCAFATPKSNQMSETEH
jgi:hypothetical protein